MFVAWANLEGNRREGHCGVAGTQKTAARTAPFFVYAIHRFRQAFGMDIDGELFFAAGVSFRDFNAKSQKVIDHFHARIHGFYIEPARLLC
jgi:hypothetical protein